MNNNDLVCYELLFEENKDEDERFEEGDEEEDAVANKKICRSSSPVWHLKEELPTLLQLWGEDDEKPSSPKLQDCWKCGKGGATKAVVSTATGKTFYIHKQLRGYPGQCDVFSK
jgi:hypothetical protein